MNKVSQISKIYANVLISIEMSNDVILENLKTVIEVLNISSELQEIIRNPIISQKQKFGIIEEIFSGKINDKMVNFLKLLIEKNRFLELESIVRVFEEEINKSKNIQNISVISAVELNDNSKQKILNKMQAKLNSNIDAEWIIDEDIIGGLVVKVNDDVIDTSIKTKLINLSKHIK